MNKLMRSNKSTSMEHPMTSISCFRDFIYGKPAPVLKYEAASMTYRKIWPSPSFRMKHVEIFKILESVCGTFESKWTLLQSRDEFIAEHATAIRCHRTTNIIALLNSSEPKAGSVKHMMDALSC